MSDETLKLPAPRYEHDCATCVFLGTSEGDDLYFHPGGCFSRTVVARHSSTPPDCSSGLHFAEAAAVYAIPALVEAKRRAILRSLLKDQS